MTSFINMDLMKQVEIFKRIIMEKEVLEMISKAVGTQCKVGTIVITTDYEIPTSGTVANTNGAETPYRFELLEQMDGYVWVVGGICTAYFFRLVEGARGE